MCYTGPKPPNFSPYLSFKKHAGWTFYVALGNSEMGHTKYRGWEIWPKEFPKLMDLDNGPMPYEVVDWSTGEPWVDEDLIIARWKSGGIRFEDFHDEAVVCVVRGITTDLETCTIKGRISQEEWDRLQNVFRAFERKALQIPGGMNCHQPEDYIFMGGTCDKCPGNSACPHLYCAVHGSYFCVCLQGCARCGGNPHRSWCFHCCPKRIAWRENYNRRLAVKREDVLGKKRARQHLLHARVHP